MKAHATLDNDSRRVAVLDLSQPAAVAQIAAAPRSEPGTALRQPFLCVTVAKTVEAMKSSVNVT